jgi:hypothetical protein
MAGDASNIKVWETGDVYIFDHTKTYDPATAIPADAGTPLHVGADWHPCGLMMGDPGVGMTRSVERTDVNSWQQGRVLERIKNPKSDISFTLLEDNETTLWLVGQEEVPSVKKAYVALEFVDDNGHVKRWFSLAEVRLFVGTDNQTQDVKGREVTGSLVPVAGKYWKIQQTATPASTKAAPTKATGSTAGATAAGTP